ncbi:MAG: ribonuclease HII [Chloroflexota bacterium]
MSDKIPRKHKTASCMLEAKYLAQGYQHIIGIDEAGRGPMAGPLVAGAVCLPLDDIDALKEALKGVKDSKEMTRNQREDAFTRIQETALAWGIGSVDAHEMPQVGNMTQVTYLAIKRAVTQAIDNGAITKPDVLLIDYLKLPADDYDGIPQEAIKHGEKHSLSIAAASVLAKVYRDERMREYAEQYSEYGFDQHKGYPTKAHRLALQTYGATPIHRVNYRPVQDAIEARNSS